MGPRAPASLSKGTLLGEDQGGSINLFVIWRNFSGSPVSEGLRIEVSIEQPRCRPRGGLFHKGFAREAGRAMLSGQENLSSF